MGCETRRPRCCLCCCIWGGLYKPQHVARSLQLSVMSHGRLGANSRHHRGQSKLPRIWKQTAVQSGREGRNQVENLKEAKDPSSLPFRPRLIYVSASIPPPTAALSILSGGAGSSGCVYKVSKSPGSVFSFLLGSSQTGVKPPYISPRRSPSPRSHQK